MGTDALAAPHPGDTVKRVGHGLGVAQRAILDAIPRGGRGLTSGEIAVAVGRSVVQVRAAVATLETRGHVVVSRGSIGQREDGMPIYGRMVTRPSPRGRLVEVSPAEAVEFVRRWHYSNTAVRGVLRYGWEIGGQLAGVSIFDTGTHNMRAGVFGPEHYRHVLHHHRLAMTEAAPKFSESAFIGACLRRMRAERPDIWAVVTYADECESHVGTIYQATNAIYTGRVGVGNLKFRTRENGLVPTQSLAGTWPERRALAAARGWREVRCTGKHRYVYLLGTARQQSCRPPLRWGRERYPRAVVRDLDAGVIQSVESTL